MPSDAALKKAEEVTFLVQSTNNINEKEHIIASALDSWGNEKLEEAAKVAELIRSHEAPDAELPYEIATAIRKIKVKELN